MKKITNYSFNETKSIFWLINKYFWKSWYSIFLAAVLSFLIMIVSYVQLPYLKNAPKTHFFFSCIPIFMQASIIPIALISLPYGIIEFRKSIILRKIKNSSLNEWTVNLIFMLYYFLIVLASNIIILLFSFVWVNKDLPFFINTISWGEFIFSTIFSDILAISIGLFFGSIIKKQNLLWYIGIIVIILSYLYIGQILPAKVLFKNTFAKILRLFIPTAYGFGMMNMVFFCGSYEKNFHDIFSSNKDILNAFTKGRSIFNLNDPFIQLNYSDVKIEMGGIYFESWEKYFNLFGTFILIILFYVLASKLFKWTDRQ